MALMRLPERYRRNFRTFLCTNGADKSSSADQAPGASKHTRT